MTTPPPAGKKRRLGEILKDAGLITELQLKAALSEQRKWGGKLGRTLVEMGFVDEAAMAAALSGQINLPLVDLDSLQIKGDVINLLRVDVAERYGVFPIGGDSRSKTLHVATSDPTNFESLQELAFHTGMRIQVSISGPTAIDRAIRKNYYGERTTSSETATPSLLGIEEQSFDAQDIGGSAESPLLASAAMGTDPYAISPRSATQAETERRLKELTDRLDTLEKQSAQQAKALRGLVELLMDKGQLNREEYLAKVRGKE